MPIDREAINFNHDDFNHDAGHYFQEFVNKKIEEKLESVTYPIMIQSRGAYCTVMAGDISLVALTVVGDDIVATCLNPRQFILEI